MRICFLFVFDQLFKNDGAIGGYITGQEEEDSNYEVSYSAK